MVNDFYTAFQWLSEHPVFYYRPVSGDSFFCSFPSNLSIMAVKVNPNTLMVDENEDLNTKTQIWLEITVYEKIKNEYEYTEIQVLEGVSSHDSELDCGGDTFEEAIIELANKVYKLYGDYDKNQIVLPMEAFNN